MIRIDNLECYSIVELYYEYSRDDIQGFISSFKCSINEEVEKFLIRNSIDFTDKHQAITYLIFDKSKEQKSIVAYFTLSIKPINIGRERLSVNSLKKVLRLSEFNDDEVSISSAAYLIAQVGKCDGSEANLDLIFEFIDYIIGKVQNACGGVVEFLESENNDKLIKMYQNKGFKSFNIRKSKSGEDRKLVQMYRLI